MSDNNLAGLNDHLFAQMARLSAPDLTAEQIEQEARRADAIVAVSEQILKGADTRLKMVKIVADHGDRFRQMLPQIEGPTE